MEQIKTVESIGLSDHALKSLSSIIESINDNFIEMESIECPSQSSLSEILQSLNLYYSDFKDNLEHLQAFLIETRQKTLVKQTKTLSSPDFIKTIGLWMLKQKIIERPLRSILTTKTPNRQYLHDLLPLVYASDKFSPVLQSVGDYYHKILDKEIDEELKKVPIDVTPAIIMDYRKVYYREKIPFDQYIKAGTSLKGSMSNRSNFVDPSSANLRKEFEVAIEKKKMEEKKQEQQDKFDNYEKYFQMDERELDRAKRQGDQRRRVVNKQTRRDKFKK